MLDYSVFKKGDFLIVLGDFGVLWQKADAGEWRLRYEKHALEWLTTRPWTTLFIDGNHENFDRLDALEVSDWHGGKVHAVNDHVIHLMRGQIYDIEDKSFFAMGGAPSIDKHLRIPRTSWWEQEIPSDNERNEAISNLDKANWKVDYVLTHDCPACAYERLGELLGHYYDADEWNIWLDGIEERLDYKKWFYGHYHEDFPEEEKLVPLYNDVVRLDDGLVLEHYDKAGSDKNLMPKPKHHLGYTLREISEYTGETLEEVEKAFNTEMRGSTVAINEDREILVYPEDVFYRILSLV